MQVGYARVSTKDQNLDLQREALKKRSCEKIYEDKISGTKASCQGLDLALEVLREGDSLVVWKLDRLGRNVKDLVTLVGELEKRGIHFKSLTDNIDTSSTAGRFFFHVMASLAQMERELLEHCHRRGQLETQVTIQASKLHLEAVHGLALLVTDICEWRKRFYTEFR